MFIDRAGQRFGRLTAETYTLVTLSSGRRMSAWRCICDCGNRITVMTTNLTKPGHTSSCGCYKRDVLGALILTHGATRTRDGHKRWPEYSVYRQMRDRCGLRSAPNFPWYGGRGIRVCRRWLFGDGALSGFECFLADMGRRPEGTILGRKNPFGDYEPGNCRWTTKGQTRRQYDLLPKRQGVKAA